MTVEKNDYKKYGFWKVEDLSDEDMEEYGGDLDEGQLYAGDAEDAEKVFQCPHCGGYILDVFNWSSDYKPCKHFLFTFSSLNNEYRFVSDSFAQYLQQKYVNHKNYKKDKKWDNKSGATGADLLDFFNEKCPDDAPLFFMEEKEPGLGVLDDMGQSGHYCGCQESVTHGIGSDDFIDMLVKFKM